MTSPFTPSKIYTPGEKDIKAIELASMELAAVGKKVTAETIAIEMLEHEQYEALGLSPELLSGIKKIALNTKIASAGLIAQDITYSGDSQSPKNIAPAANDKSGQQLA